MFVNNWYKALATSFCKTGNTLKDITGASFNLYSSFTPCFGGSGGNCYMADTYKDKKYWGVVFGTGNTPPTVNDYKISGTEFTAFTANSSVSNQFTTNGLVTTATFTLTNTGTSEVTIKEVALYGGSYKSSTSYTKFLIDRTLLDSPVTIPAGGIGQVIYTIRVN